MLCIMAVIKALDIINEVLWSRCCMKLEYQGRNMQYNGLHETWEASQGLWGVHCEVDVIQTKNGAWINISLEPSGRTGGESWSLALDKDEVDRAFKGEFYRKVLALHVEGKEMEKSCS